jgi:hypothetical protein
MTRKLYCYADESGQDTLGALFVVSVVIAAEERDDLLRRLEAIEEETRKRRVKWLKSTYTRRLAYIQRVLETPIFQRKLCFAIYQDSLDYFELTIQTIAAALSTTHETAYQAIVLIDALPPTQVRIVSSLLRRAGVSTRKVRGVRREESDALIRLADALCGFVRAAFEGQAKMRVLFERAMRRGILRDVSQQKAPILRIKPEQRGESLEPCGPPTHTGSISAVL